MLTVAFASPILLSSNAADSTKAIPSMINKIKPNNATMAGHLAVLIWCIAAKVSKSKILERFLVALTKNINNLSIINIFFMNYINYFPPDQSTLLEMRLP